MSRYRSAVQGYSIAAHLMPGYGQTVRNSGLISKKQGLYYWGFTESDGGRIARYDWRIQRWFYGCTEEQHKQLLAMPKGVLVRIERKHGRHGRITFEQFNPKLHPYS